MESQTQTASRELLSVSTNGETVEQLLDKEWLLSNTRGGYSSSTIIGCNTRRYHGLLVGSLNPPANRIMALSNLMEMIIWRGKVLNLATFEFDGKFNPAGFQYITGFRRDCGVHFDYNVEGIELTKSVYLLRNSDTIAVQYEFHNLGPGAPGFEFVLRPFVGLRDFHSLQRSYAPLRLAELEGDLFVCHDVPGSCELLMSCSQMEFDKDPQWWFNFVYREEKARGQDFIEDLWSPGFYKCMIAGPCKAVLRACVGSRCQARELESPATDIEPITVELDRTEGLILAAGNVRDQKSRKLVLAADQFICKRGQVTGAQGRVTLLAGYPWFFDWGRDAFISLPGLLLATGRVADARSVLTTFAAAAQDGMIPNRFDDHSDTAYFNSIDASLWFINACFAYLQAVGDGATFTKELLPAIIEIVEGYHRGTHFGIRADGDGLITGGSDDTQLTWMDAKHGGVAFTPRHGKTVEINALWYNALCWLAKFYATWDMQRANHFDAMAEQTGAGFCRAFWNEQTGYLNDCIAPDGTADTSCRPNQIFAVSLEFSPLPHDQQRQIVQVVEEKLLTPFGLRSLAADDPKYHGRYEGPQRSRDESYHQGTVWAWLMGPFVEAYLKVNEFSPAGKDRAREFVAPLIRHLDEDGCLGSISEIFDGDEPHTPRGCFAQAWSVAELIRALQLIES